MASIIAIWAERTQNTLSKLSKCPAYITQIAVSRWPHDLDWPINVLVVWFPNIQSQIYPAVPNTYFHIHTAQTSDRGWEYVSD